MTAAGTGPWRPREWEELNACPLVQPYWCAHPHCLSCNWDEEEADTWFYPDATLVRHPGSPEEILLADS